MSKNSSSIVDSGHKSNKKQTEKNAEKQSNTNAEPNIPSSPIILAHFGADSVKMIAESIGISNLSDDVARFVADDITMKIKCIAQDATKYMSHARRTILSSYDIDYALKNKNIQAMLGYCDKELLPFKFVTGGGRELYFQEEKDVDLTDLVNMSTLAKLPLDTSLKSHWLSIDGVQPAIPDNPPPLTKDELAFSSTNPLAALKINDSSDIISNKFIAQRQKKLVEVVKIKQYSTQELTREQQLYFKEITEACVGSCELKRSEALQSLAKDSGIHQMIPRLVGFISEGVKINVVQNNLALLIYLMRMAKSLLDNTNLYMEKYLHELIPTIMTCILTKQLCLRPDHDNHWAIRDFGSRLISQICKTFNTTTNNIQVRITQLLSQALDNERLPYSSLYGVISCFGELGIEVIKIFVLNRLRMISERIERENAQNSPPVTNIIGLVNRIISPVIKVI